MMEKIAMGFTGLWLLVLVACLVGWVLNIVKLIGLGGWTGNEFEIVLRVAGLPVIPLGGVMGWL